MNRERRRVWITGIGVVTAAATGVDAFRAALDECGGELGFRRSIDEGNADELIDALQIGRASCRERVSVVV